MEWLTKKEIEKKYAYAKGYLCHKILMEELEGLEEDEKMRDPRLRMISEKKVMSNNSWYAYKLFLTYTHTKGISKEEFLSAIKGKFKDNLTSYLIVEEGNGENRHIHMFLTFGIRKRIGSADYFDLSFVLNGKLVKKQAWIENVYNDEMGVVFYFRKQDDSPLTNMLLENGRILKILVQLQGR